MRQFHHGMARRIVENVTEPYPGAVGMEMLAGLYVSYAQQWNRLLWAMMTLIEEGLEMAGVLILIYALLSYMANYAQEVRIRVGDRPALALDAAPASPYTNSR